MADIFGSVAISIAIMAFSPTKPKYFLYLQPTMSMRCRDLGIRTLSSYKNSLRFNQSAMGCRKTAGRLGSFRIWYRSCLSFFSKKSMISSNVKYELSLISFTSVSLSLLFTNPVKRLSRRLFLN